MRSDDLRRAAIDSLVDWHTACFAARGHRAHRGARWWTMPGPDPMIWFTAISRTPGATLADRAVRQLCDRPAAIALCDTHDSLDPTGAGFVLRRRAPFFARPPGRPPAARPCDLAVRVRRVRHPADLAAFEATSAAAFGTPPAMLPLHPAPILARRGLALWLAEHDGVPVAVAMSLDRPHGRGLYGVGTVPAARRAGIATHLTATLVAGAGDRPVVLQPSDEAAGLYRRLGFGPVGSWALWVRR